ncbi:hypothetical protein ACFOU0_00680 [Salinicoccus sesuvii]|uniref:General stress protein 17M-like domain-containing protein n=1 Tax=Salinicoccus sesuvii TaxID=868281 RepID=A0ABV7N3H7_9STAP
MKITISNNKRSETALSFDLSNPCDVKKAHEYKDKLMAEGYDYTITCIKSEWEKSDEYTSLDDVTETVLLLGKMSDLQYQIFVSIAQEEIHVPTDIAINVLDNDIIQEDIDSVDPDDIWETVQVDSKDYAVLY